jgi:hypothetical protein
MSWIKVTNNKVQWHAVVNMVMNPSGCIAGGEILDQFSNFSSGPLLKEGKVEIVLFL